MNMFLAKMSTLMMHFGMLLADTETKTYSGNIPGWLEALVNTAKNIINPILIVAATAGILYAIVVGVKFIKADNKEEREEAKQKLITVIVGIVVTLVLIVVFYWLAWALQNGVIRFSQDFAKK